MASSNPPSSSASSHEPLVYIRPSVIERLANGSFKADRRSSRRAGRDDDAAKDRRRPSTPLTVLKHYLPVLPQVFTDRKTDIISLAKALNSANTKMLTISGPSGAGKTSLIRGLIELMGGGPEQVLWVDATFAHTETELATFLVDALQFLARQTKAPQADTPHTNDSDASTDPMALLQRQLNRLSQQPIVIVLDHIETLLTEAKQFASPIPHELIGFMQTLPNIKLIISGTQLPNTLNQYTGVVPHTLSGLPLWQQLAQHLGMPNTAKPHTLVPAALQQCTTTQTMLASLLLTLQHPVTLAQLHALLTEKPNTKGTPPAFPLQALATPKQCFATLKSAPYKVLLKRSLSPQRLLAAWQQASQNPQLNHPTDELDAEWYYQWHECATPLLSKVAPVRQLYRYHQQLAQYYLAQRLVPLNERLLPVANSALVQQARKHLQAAEELKQHANEHTSEPDDETPATPAAVVDDDDDTDLEALLAEDDAQNETAPPKATTHTAAQAAPPTTIVVNTLAPAPAPATSTAPQPTAPVAAAPTQPTTDTNTSTISVSSPSSPQPTTPTAPAASVVPHNQAPSTTHTALAEPPPQQVTQWLQQAQQHQSKAEWQAAHQLLHNIIAQCATTTRLAQWWQAHAHKQLAHGHVAQWQLDQAQHHALHANTLADILTDAPAAATTPTPLPGSVMALRLECGLLLADIANQQSQPQAALKHLFDANQAPTGEPLPAKPADITTPHWQSLMAQQQFQAALAYDTLKQANEASTHYQHAISLLRQQHHWGPLSAATVNLGCLLLEANQTATAIPYLEEALNIEATHLKRPAEWVDTYRLLAQAYQHNSQADKAIDTLKQALALATTHQRADWIIGTLIDLGHASRQQKDAAAATHYYQQAQASIQQHLSAHPADTTLYGDWHTELQRIITELQG